MEILEDKKGKYRLVPCTCGCHAVNAAGGWAMHIVACCDNGFVKYYIVGEHDSNPLRSGENEKSDGI